MPRNADEMQLWCPTHRWPMRGKLPICRQFVREKEIPMGGTMVCVQRGYEPDWFGENNITDQVYFLISICFHPGGGRDRRERLRRQHANVDGYAWDFVVLIMDSEKRTVLSACYVDLRDPLDTINKVPYLYICDLCTHSKYLHLSFASQLVHGVQRLGWMMVHGDTGWKGMFPRGLYLALHVDPADDTGEHISRMYMRCGFKLADKGGILDFAGYSPYVPYPFLFEDAAKIPMCMPVLDDVWYKDGGMLAYAPGSSRGCDMYHSFPASLLPFVQERGLICPNQAKRLFGKQARWFRERKGLYTSLGVWFSQEKPVGGDGMVHFVIRASDVDGAVQARLLSQGTIPMYMAIRIDGV